MRDRRRDGRADPVAVERPAVQRVADRLPASSRRAPGAAPRRAPAATAARRRRGRGSPRRRCGRRPSARSPRACRLRHRPSRPRRCRRWSAPAIRKTDRSSAVQPFSTISTAPICADRWRSSAARLPPIHGAAASSNSSVQRSPMPLPRLPCEWVWALTRPGWISRRAAAISRAPSGAGTPGGPNSRIVSSSIRMSAGSAVPALMSSTLPPRMIV